jgi:hypothetical protein
MVVTTDYLVVDRHARISRGRSGGAPRVDQAQRDVDHPAPSPGGLASTVTTDAEDMPRIDDAPPLTIALHLTG